MMTQRFEVVPKNLHPSSELSAQLTEKLGRPCQVTPIQVMIANHDTQVLGEAREILIDEVDQVLGHAEDDRLDLSQRPYWFEVQSLPGVTDNTARSVSEAFGLLGKVGVQVSSVTLYGIEFEGPQEELADVCNQELCNELLHSAELYKTEDLQKRPRFADCSVSNVQAVSEEEIFLDAHADQATWEEWNKTYIWALNSEELATIREYFQREDVLKRRETFGLKGPTRAEVEVLAQTWSEHCKHKIFASSITYSESGNVDKKIGNQKIDSIFKTYIRGATSEVAAPWAVSVFTDNAGIVRFDSNIDLCIKVETHNSPSALDPYGGALTGILGVNRDIMGCGLGARPIANTNVFCVANEEDLDRSQAKLPVGIRPPENILRGIHAGVRDGGNKSGIPTVNGAITYDSGYAGKPLVYCGTVGILPQKTEKYPDLTVKGQKPGDKVVVVGGAVGKDGIHGATFSSMELTEGAPATVVQIGDPLTQKRVMDFQMRAQELGLFSSVTDNGAGGISSSIGEMAELTGGAKIDLARVPLKYPGVSPFEILISESQERMSYSVPAVNAEEFVALARSYGVHADILGEFTNTGVFEVYFGETCIAALDMEFMHEGVPQLQLKAHWDGPKKREHWYSRTSQNISKTADLLKAVLSDPTVRSKEEWVRQYDHEVQAATARKPFIGGDHISPGDAGVVALAPHGGEEKRGVSISCGMAPQLSHLDGYTMAIAATDECVRNAIASGANPDKLALVDNFCWPDPIKSEKNPDGERKLAQLVRSCVGLYDYCTTFGMPLVSGKDSMKNDFIGRMDSGETVKISVPPTLLVSAIADVEDVTSLPRPELRKAGDVLIGIGVRNTTKRSNGIASDLAGNDPLVFKNGDLQKNRELYRQLYKLIQGGEITHIHDVSDGGAWTSVSEMSFSGKLGAEIDLDETALLNEDAFKFVASVEANKVDDVRSKLGGDVQVIGTVTDRPQICALGETFEKSELETLWRNR